MKKTINNEITESHCSFEVVKLLKEKGFDVKCVSYYRTEYSPLNGGVYGSTTVCDYDQVLSDRYNDLDYKHLLRPTHALAIEWLRVNFNIWISIYISTGFDGFSAYVVHKKKGGWDSEEFKSPQEAVEAALKYVLENVI